MFGSGFGLELEWVKVFLAKLHALCGGSRERMYKVERPVEKGVASGCRSPRSAHRIRRRVLVRLVLSLGQKTHHGRSSGRCSGLYKMPVFLPLRLSFMVFIAGAFDGWCIYRSDCARNKLGLRGRVFARLAQLSLLCCRTLCCILSCHCHAVYSCSASISRATFLS